MKRVVANVPGPRRWWEAGLVVGAVVLGAAGHTFHDVLEGMPFWRALAPAAPIVAEVAVLSAGHQWATRRRIAPGVMAAVGLATSAVFGYLIVALHTGWNHASGITALTGLAAGLGILGGWGLVFLVPAALRDAQERARDAERARRDAELTRLRTSLQPHFLLNTLNAIVGMIGSEPQDAKRLVVVLGDLLRDSLEDGPELRPFADDVAWLRRYAEILEVRHGDKLRFVWELAPECMAVVVPRLLLQPLLENAVKHGALRRGEGGVVTVRSFVQGEGEAAAFVVADNGPGPGAELREGLGLTIVRRRLEQALPGATLRLDASGEGTTATITVPSGHEAAR
jgi:signal transduction histidine kinase